MDWRELNDELTLRQTGELPEDEIESTVPPSMGTPFGVNAEYANSVLEKYGLGKQSIAEQQANLDMAAGAARDLDWSAIRDAYGYGENRRDWRTPIDEWIDNPTDYRANAQSQANKVINGAVKMGTTFLTTYADNTVGLLAGLLGVVKDAVDGDGFSMNSFVDTGFARKMQDIRDEMEKVFPNYRTEEEQVDQDRWWRHLNGNFWGDSFLKNLGFTIGAGASAKTFARGFQYSQGKVVREAYKAAVAAASKGENEVAAFRKILQGAALENPNILYREFTDIAKKYRNIGWESQVLGSLGGAVGESRTEAITAAKEFHDEQQAAAINAYNNGQHEIANRLMENPDFWMDQPVYDGFGNIIDYEKVLTPEAEAYRDEELARLWDEYHNTMSVVDSEADSVADKTFWLNIPVLWGSNAVMFGRMLSGGFRTQSNYKFRGQMGNLRGVGSTARAIGLGLSKPFTEGMEELTQKMISEGSKDISEQRMSAFHDNQYDPDALKGIAGWVSMLNSAGDVVSSGSSWQEFAIGALTGGIGHVANFTRTEEGVKWDPVGGIYGGIQEGLREKRENNTKAQELNKRWNDPEFRALWGGLVRHKHYDNTKDVALSENQKFVWKSEDQKQMISDVIMFADAGRLNDLEGYVDAFANLSIDEIGNIRELLSDATDNEFANKTDSELKEWIGERAKEVKDTIRQYRDFHDSIELLSLGTSDADVINELVFTASQLENFEKRYAKLSKEVWDKIAPAVERVARRKTKKGEPTKAAKEAQAILDSVSSTQRLFGVTAVDLSARSEDDKRTIDGLFGLFADDTYQEQIIETLEKWKAFAKKPALKEEVRDLQKLTRARYAYYAKLFDPTFRQKFEEEKIKPEEVAEEIQEDENRTKAQSNIDKLKEAKSLQDFVRIWSGLDPSTPEVGAHEDALIAADKKLSAYYKQYTDTVNFINGLREDVDREASKASAEQQIDWSQVADVLSGMESEPVILSSNPGDDPLVAVGKALLSGLAGNQEAEDLARKILQDRLKNIAIANNLGVVKRPTPPSPAPSPAPAAPPSPAPTPAPAPGSSLSPAPGGEGESGSGGSGGRIGTEDEEAIAKSAEELSTAVERLEKVVSLDSEWLQKILNNDFSDYPNLIDQDKYTLLSLAMDKRNKLMDDKGNIAGKQNVPVAPIDDPYGNDELKARYAARRNTSVDGTPFSVEDIDEAREKGKRKYKNVGGTKQLTYDWLRKKRVHAFLASGALAELAMAYRKAGKNLPIYYIANPHAVDDDLKKNPFAFRKEGKGPAYNPFNIGMAAVQLAVDMNEIVPGTSKTARQFLESYENAQVFGDSTLITVEENGEEHKYQVIGTMLSSPDNKDTQLMWEHTVKRSIFPQYYADAGKNGTGGIPESGKWYVARIHPDVDTTETDTHKPDWSTGKKIFTTLNYIMPGRKETTAPESEKAVKTPLRESLAQYTKQGKKVHWAIITDDEPALSPGAPGFPQTINAPAGSLWIATQNADGSWSWDYVTIARLNEKVSESALDLTNSTSAIATKVNSLLDKVFKESDPNMSDEDRRKDFEERAAALRGLDRVFYLGSGNTFHLSFDQFGPVLAVGGAWCHTKEEVIAALKDANYRFQVTPSDIGDKAVMDSLISEGVLSAEMNSFTRIAVNIGINKLSDRDADNNAVEVHVLDAGDSLQVSMANTASIGGGRYNNSVRFGSRAYKLNQDGTVSEVGSTEPVVSSVITAAVKVGAELLELESAGQLEAFSGERWVVDTPNIQYTELYEKTVNGVTVHVERRGRNGAFMFQFDDTEWSHLQEVAEKISKEDNGYQREEDIESLNQQFDKVRAEEEGGTVAPKKKKKTSAKLDGKAETPKKTITEVIQSESEEQTEIEC